MSERPAPDVVTCRKCGAVAGPPIYSSAAYGGRPALFWACSRPEEACGYTWTLLIYREPEVEIRELRWRLDKAEQRLEHRT